MKKTSILATLLSLLVISSARADTIAQWTFETSQPGVVTLPAVPGAGVWLTNIIAEVGSGVASGWHSASATFSSPAGNGSGRSFSVNTWTTVGDLFQFAVSTTGYESISLSWEQTSSSTGPKLFNLDYSTDGLNFSTFAANYIVRTNATAVNNSGSGVDTDGSWTTSTTRSGYSYSYDLSSVTALDDEATVYFRLALSDLYNAAGNLIPSGGTDRVDNFTVTGTLIPEPSVMALSLLGGVALLGLRRRN